MTTTTDNSTRANAAGTDKSRTIADAIRRQLADPTPVYAALGASEVVARRVEQVARQGAAFVAKVRAEDGVDASHLPRFAVGHALTVAGKLETAYGDMAERGRGVAQRVKDGRQATELLRLAFVTLNRARPGHSSPTVVVGETVTVTTEAPVPTPAPSTTEVPPTPEAVTVTETRVAETPVAQAPVTEAATVTEVPTAAAPDAVTATDAKPAPTPKARRPRKADTAAAADGVGPQA
jgi:F420-0:gamma-glutamyl ligase-like protein